MLCQSLCLKWHQLGNLQCLILLCTGLCHLLSLCRCLFGVFPLRQCRHSEYFSSILVLRCKVHHIDGFLIFQTTALLDPSHYLFCTGTGVGHICCHMTCCNSWTKWQGSVLTHDSSISLRRHLSPRRRAVFGMSMRWWFSWDTPSKLRIKGRPSVIFKLQLKRFCVIRQLVDHLLQYVYSI